VNCVRCDEAKPRDAFVNDRTRVTGKFPWCKPCVLEYRRETKARERATERPLAVAGERACPGCHKSLEGAHANRRFCSASCKDRVRHWRSFGLSPDDYRALIASNDGLCPICKRGVKMWVLDHNHETGEVTGACCSVCNQSLIAYSRHEVETARRLVAYLEDPPLPRILGERRYVGPETLDQIEREKGWRAARGPYSVGLSGKPYEQAKADELERFEERREERAA
jgi:hypothetical protein